MKNDNRRVVCEIDKYGRRPNLRAALIASDDACTHLNLECGSDWTQLVVCLSAVDALFGAMLDHSRAFMREEQLNALSALRDHLKATGRLIGAVGLESNLKTHGATERLCIQPRHTLHSLMEYLATTATNVRPQITPQYDKATLVAGMIQEAANSRFERLSCREREVFAHLVEGHSNKVIAYKLNVSQTTVKSHVNRVLRKLGVPSRMRAVALLRHNVISPG